MFEAELLPSADELEEVLLDDVVELFSISVVESPLPELLELVVSFSF
jgi:hypothetical protein